MCVGMVCSCLGSACVGCCCSSLKDCRVKHGPASRIPYIFIMFLLCIFAVIMTLYGDTEIYENDLLDIKFVVCDPDDNEACVANGTVYRVSACLFLFFVIHAAIVKAVASFHWLFFSIKMFTLIGVLVLTYFIPNEPFYLYSDFARFASAIFLLLQVLILINWAYDVNERVVDKANSISKTMEEDGSDKAHKAGLCCVQFGLVAATVLIYVVIIIFIVFFFIWFDPSQCDTAINSTVIGITIVLVLIITVVPIMLETSYLFTNAVVSFYITYLCFSALENVPDLDCNEFANNENNTTMWIGIIVTAVAISYVGFSVSSKSGLLKDDNATEEINMELEAGTKKRGQDTGDDAGMDGDTNDKSNYDDDANLGESNYDDAESKPRNEPDVSQSALEVDQRANVEFHVCMAFAAAYMAMLYTNWAPPDYKGEDAAHWNAVWVNLIAQYITVVLFLWTAIAPKACPDRFGKQREEI